MEQAWTQLSRVGLTALFATRLWYSIEDVDELMVNADEWKRLLGVDGLATASFNGFWYRSREGAALICSGAPGPHRYGSSYLWRFLEHAQALGKSPLPGTQACLYFTSLANVVALDDQGPASSAAETDLLSR